MYKPFISCKCITYGRTNILVEALHSFLIQDYPEDKCELVIVNDCPFQTLVFDHPQIKIYNLKETFPLIGEKENYAIERCRGELIAVWDDDDIALSNHLSNIAHYWEDNVNIIHWANGVYYNEPNISALTSLGNSGIVYSKEAWYKIGKSPLMNAGGDTVLVEALHHLPGATIQAHPEDKDISWFYMWGGRGYHQSGLGTDVPGRENIIKRHTYFIEGLRQLGKVPEGEIILKPKWNHDYAVMLKAYIDGNS
jgi:glycosyltransferase involved in cell wall biosynthesis